ncbi:DJ-1 family protein [Klebsiella michiganensis]|nr:DJ-1 family protein [Klebsiella michiganensis]
MSASALICLAPGSEETEAVTTIDLLVRGGVKVTTAQRCQRWQPDHCLLARR